MKSAKKVTFSPAASINDGLSSIGQTIEKTAGVLLSPSTITHSNSAEQIAPSSSKESQSYFLRSQIAMLEEMLLFNKYDKQDTGRVQRTNSFC